MAKTTYETQLALSDHDRLEDKHWSECRMIAHYDDELHRARQLLTACRRHIHQTTQGLELKEEIDRFLEAQP